MTLLPVAAKAGLIFWQSHAEGAPLAVRWEGAVIDLNTRDVGASVNACLGEPLLREGVVQRAAGWFSGWSCDNVGAPDVIYSLNHDPHKPELFYCRDGDHNKVGRFFNHDVVLSDLEFVATWQDPAMRAGACGFFNDSFASIASGKRILVHCDAGRDRTGAYAGLVAALAAEAAGKLDERMVEAIECDYEKSKSLAHVKYGRIRSLLSELRERGGIAAFFARECGTDPALLQRAADALTAR